MPKITVHAGDFLKGNSKISSDALMLRTEAHSIVGEKIWVTELDTVEIATEENVKKLGGTVGWGIAGAALLGPVGLLAGVFLGGRKKEVTFIAKFKDGRKLLGTTDSKIFTKLPAACGAVAPMGTGHARTSNGCRRAT